MQTDIFKELFPLFDPASVETLEWLLSEAVERDYPAGRAVLMEDAWGNAVYFVLSGWLKVRFLRSQDATTLAILSHGDFFGEMAILDESPRSTDVVAFTSVRVLSIPAQKFIQFLFKDPQLHHRSGPWFLTGPHATSELRGGSVRFPVTHSVLPTPETST